MHDDLALHLAYVELTHRYADAVDRGDGEAVADLFAEGASWDGTEFGLTVVTGREALVEQFASDGPTGTVHLVSNQLVDRAARRPTATSYGHAVIQRPDRIRHVIVRYEDVLVERDGSWRFDRRTLRRAVSF